MADRSSATPSDYLAAERTFLAWVRTGLALMGFGFVVARFGLFLRVLGGHANVQLPAHASSFWFGPVLIVVGVVVTALSAWNHLRLIHAMKQGDSIFGHPSWLGLGLALFLAALGLAMTIYLISVRDLRSEDRGEHLEGTMTTEPANGMVTLRSRHSVDETVARFEDLLKAKEIKLFTVIDHSGEAEKAGLQMRPTKVLIFGNPKAGTPLMVASPSVAIDLPLKALVFEDASGDVWVTYNSPAYLLARHGLGPELAQNIAVVGTLASAVAGDTP